MVRRKESYMYVTIYPQGRTGNRLVQYALALIIAKDKGYKFIADPLPPFNFIKVEPRRLPEEQSQPTLKTSSYGENYYDYKEILDHKGNIRVDSYVQKADILYKNREFLKSQFRLPYKITKLPEDNELVIHIRETDYKQHGWYLGDNFYLNFIKENKNKYSTISIVTDNIRSELIEKLKDKGCKIVTPGPCQTWDIPTLNQNDIHDFLYMYHADNLLISQSSYSFWPALLGDHKKVIIPYSKEGKNLWPLNPDKDDPDLFFGKDTIKYIA